jgi:signal transduction histidine kinase
MDKSHAESTRLRVVGGMSVVMAFLLCLLLLFILVKYILRPVRRLAMEADREGLARQAPDEVTALSRSVHGLIEDVNHTHSELRRSRETLLQEGKMALVGKLAAGVAHSIRNPLTSVKMRLFSLDRTLDLSDAEREDFDVIAEEIGHIDTIVRNFIEFSRPPKLKMQRASPSDVVDNVLQLLRHRLESFDVAVRLERIRRLPEIQADPEQLKEVFINLIDNACESMEEGGLIRINEKEGTDESYGRVVQIRLSDDGPGVPESFQDKIFQPFFTAKEGGSGLGLSIAARIVEEHNGRLDLISKYGNGATFIVTLPVEGVEW